MASFPYEIRIALLPPAALRGGVYAHLFSFSFISALPAGSIETGARSFSHFDSDVSSLVFATRSAVRSTFDLHLKISPFPNVGRLSYHTGEEKAWIRFTDGWVLPCFLVQRSLQRMSSPTVQSQEQPYTGSLTATPCSQGCAGWGVIENAVLAAYVSCEHDR